MPIREGQKFVDGVLLGSKAFGLDISIKKMKLCLNQSLFLIKLGRNKRKQLDYKSPETLNTVHGSEWSIWNYSIA